MVAVSIADQVAPPMPTVPVPFVVSLLLLVLLVRIVRQGQEGSSGAAVFLRPVVLLIVACTVQSVLIGLRWGYGVQSVQFATPVLAAVLPPLIFIGFAGLTRTNPGARRNGIWLHGLPPAAIAVLVLSWRETVDLALVTVYLGYAFGLWRLARHGPDGLGGARLEGAVPAYRALQIAITALIGAAMVDVLVGVDFEWTRGQRAAVVVGLANALWVLVLGAVAAMVGPTPAPAEVTLSAQPERYPDIDAQGDPAVIARIDDLMRGQRLYRDADLTLGRLARRAGVPARHISAAVNRVHARNVSQYINGFRIADACRLLTDTDHQVSHIMFEVGFQTKSNFNREFRRVTGMSPLDWRAGKTAG